MQKRTQALLFSAALLLAAHSAAAQQPTAAASPQVGDLAPDFALPGATRYGLLKESVRLSDYRGRTVVLAFFFRARTRG
jgi:hypothetical protein